MMVFRSVVQVLSLTLLALLGSVSCSGLRAPELETLARIETTVAGVATKVDRLEVKLSVGGGGDSITAWMYAAIAGAALLYPIVIRPIRRSMEKHREEQKEGSGQPSQGQAHAEGGHGAR